MALVCCILVGAAPAAAQLIIRGVDSRTEEVLKAFLTIDELPCGAPHWWVERRNRQAADQIRQAMETLGYYHAKATQSLEWKGGCWHAVYRIDAGDPVRIQKVDLEIEGSLRGQPPMREAVAALEIAPEEPYSDEVYEKAKSQLLETAQELGYFDAEFTRHQVRVDPVTNLAEIELTLAGGERYRIGDVNVHQQVLTDSLFHEFLRFQKGDFYSADALTRTYRNLIDSDYFDRVLVVPDLDRRENGVVPIDVTAAAETRRRVLVGAGYATDTGPRGRLDVHYRRLNDQGHRANLHTLVSPVSGEVQADYRIPYGNPTNEYWFVNGEVTYEETDTSKNVKHAIGVGRTHQLAPAWAQTNYVQYSKENFDIGGDHGRSNLLLFGTSWARSTTIDTPRPLEWLFVQREPAWCHEGAAVRQRSDSGHHSRASDRPPRWPRAAHRPRRGGVDISRPFRRPAAIDPLLRRG